MKDYTWKEPIDLYTKSKEQINGLKEIKES